MSQHTEANETTKDRIPRTIYWDKDLYRKVRTYAASLDMTVNKFIRELAREAVEGKKDGK